MTLTLDDTAKLGKMLAEYEEAVRHPSTTPDGILTRLHIADDIVSQALDDLMHDWLAMREIVQAVAAPRDWDYQCGSPQCSLCGVRDLSGFPLNHMSDCPVTKARALLAQDS